MTTDVTKDSNTLAQLAHVGWGGFLTLLLTLFVGAWWATAVVAAFTLGKESAESLGLAFWEPKQTWLSSTIDVAFWFIGIALALTALVVRKYV